MSIIKIALQNDYKWYSPIIDPPLARNYEEVQTRRKYTGAGALGGAIIGTGLGIASAMGNSKDFKGTPAEHVMNNIGRVASGTLIGMGIGNVTGNTLGNRKILKGRLKNNKYDLSPKEKAALVRADNEATLKSGPTYNMLPKG